MYVGVCVREVGIRGDETKHRDFLLNNKHIPLLVGGGYPAS